MECDVLRKELGGDSMEIWEEVKKIQGTTLKTLRHNKPFDVVEVDSKSVVVKPHVSGKERKISMQDIEEAFKELKKRGKITRVAIMSRYSAFNPAYVAAILAKLPNVTFSKKPIQLYRTS